MNNQGNNKTPSSGRDEKAAALAKLSMPRLTRGIPRPRLFEHLDEARHQAALWIAAPGGAGKTTLVATYLSERGLPFLWYQVDSDDADPATFFYYLGLAAKKAQTEHEVSLPLLTPEYLLDIPGFARRYFRKLYALLPPATILVLDNYQDLGESELFADILRCAISEAPSGYHLMVISRGEPPPALARLRVTEALGLLDWEGVRLNLDETKSIAAHSLTLDAEAVEDLHERTDGWAAGLTLLLEHIKRTGANDWRGDHGSLETIFHFFANEFFNDLPESTRDFLIKTSILAHMTPSLAQALTENAEAGAILADLHRHYYFTNRRDLAEPSYQYHALLREFLMTKAAERLSKEDYLALIRRAGQLLCENGRHEEAVILHLHSQDWEQAIPLILMQAPQLLAQGRAQIVAAWLQQLPQALIEATPWLMYWQGVSQQFINPFDVRRMLERAFEYFVSQQDILGQLSAASAIIDNIFFLRESLLLTAKWIDVLQDALQRQPSFPSPALEAGVYSSLFSALELLRPHDPLLPHYAEHLTGFLSADIDVNQKALIASRLIIYTSVISGDAIACDYVMTMMNGILDSPQVTALSKMHWATISVDACLYADNRSTHAVAASRHLLNLVEGGRLPTYLKANNLGFLEFIMSWHAFFVSLHLGDTKTAGELLERMTLLVASGNSIDMAIYQMAESVFALKRGDLPAAYKHGLASLEGHEKVGAMLTYLEVSCVVAIERCECGKPEEAFRYLEKPKTLGFVNSPRMRYQVLMIEAYAHLGLGQTDKSHECLRQGLALGYAQNYIGNILWLLRIMPRLCAEALKAGIEVEYVRHVIRERGIVPVETEIEMWPWPVKVYVLGHTHIVINDQLLTETKGQRKPLRLLEAVIALGGWEVKIDRITEIIWPDAEGDAAFSAFTTTLSRLRRWLGEEFLIVKGGRVSLDFQHCWLDVHVLEKLLDREDVNELDPEQYASYCGKLLHLYSGPFLGDEVAHWASAIRDRLRAKLGRRLSKCMTALKEAGQDEKIVQLIEKTRERDPALLDS